MTTLDVIIDTSFDTSSGVGRYSRELTRAMIATAPAGAGVRAIVPALPPEALGTLEAEFPGIEAVQQMPLGRREIALAWQSGISLAQTNGMTHSTSLFAPLRRHDRVTEGHQVIVTLHDMLAWTAPSALPARDGIWQRAMAKRAQRYADAVIVPSHAVAAQLEERLPFGGRIRVIGGAASRALVVPFDAEERARRLALPEHYILTMGSINPRKGVRELIRSLALPETGGLPLVLAGPDRYGNESALGLAAAAGLAEDRVRPVGRLGDDDLAVVFARASMFVYPSFSEGFGLPIVEAFSFGLPVVHSDDPALVEVSAGAGLPVTRKPTGEYVQRLAEAIGRVREEPGLAARLRVLAKDRSRAFSWRDSAERVWQLHADL
jgi:glycosyltransferase involved in cell wall biosynthesis